MIKANITALEVWLWRAALVGLILFAGTHAFAQTPIIDGQATVTLTWEAPTQYEDGSALAATDITGYVIYYDTFSRFTSPGNLRPGCTDTPQGTRTDAGCYSNVIDLTDGSNTSEVVVLTVDQDTTFYFAATAHVLGGTESGSWSKYSNEAEKTVVLVIDTVPPAAPVITQVDMVISCTTNLPNVTCSFIVQP